MAGEIGRYDPTTAKWVVDSIKLLLSKNYAAPGEMLASMRASANQNAIHVRNTDTEDAPGYACMQVIGIENPSGGAIDRTYLQVTQPTDQYGRDGWYVFNGPEVIAASGYGVAYAGGHGKVYGFAGSFGDRCLPQVDSWQVTKDPTGWMVFAGSDEVATNTYRVFSSPIMSSAAWFQTPVGGIPAFAASTFGKATCDLYSGSLDGSNDLTFTAATDEDSSQITHTVYNQSVDPVGAAEKIQAVLIDGLWIANYEDCGTA